MINIEVQWDLLRAHGDVIFWTWNPHVTSLLEGQHLSQSPYLLKVLWQEWILNPWNSNSFYHFWGNKLNKYSVFTIQCCVPKYKYMLACWCSIWHQFWWHIEYRLTYVVSVSLLTVYASYFLVIEVTTCWCCVSYWLHVNHFFIIF